MEPTENTQNVTSMEKSIIDDEGNDNEENYSASVCEIIQRRSSTRRQSRRKHRPSSPFGLDVDNVARRRSSAYTISSGELVSLRREEIDRVKSVRFTFQYEFIFYAALKGEL